MIPPNIPIGFLRIIRSFLSPHCWIGAIFCGDGQFNVFQEKCKQPKKNPQVHGDAGDSEEEGKRQSDFSSCEAGRPGCVRLNTSHSNTITLNKRKLFPKKLFFGKSAGGQIGLQALGRERKKGTEQPGKLRRKILDSYF